MIGARVARLSTGMRMLIILSTALLPLGLIALLASLQSARSNRVDRESEARLIANDSAGELSGAIERGTGSLRGALATLTAAPFDAATCRRTLGVIAASQRWPVRYAVFDLQGRRICATPGFQPVPAMPPTAESGVDARVLKGARALRFDIVDRRAGLVAAGELPASSVAAIVRPSLPAGSYGIVIRQGDADFAVAATTRAGPLSRLITASAPVANGQLALELTVNGAPVRAIEVLMVLLPVLMWIAAAGIGWLVVERLLLRPLAQMQRSVTSYRIGDPGLAMPHLTTPSHEIRSLADAFRDMTGRLARHDAELADGLARQMLLTREVHHRVKNNLQVVASLINLHARGAEGAEATAAYAAIQRRVDALAVVHRNHYAELEDNRGVGLRNLIGELAANLRGGAPPEAAGLAITLDLDPAYVHQDVAVPVAFLITELVEMAMSCDPRGSIAISLRILAPGRARLTVVAPGLAGEACRLHPSRIRFGRVVEGLTRQLRTAAERDEERGLFAIEIPVAAPRESDEG